jgi:hypothetical protein
MFSDKLDRKIDARADQAAREFAAPAFAKASEPQNSVLKKFVESRVSPAHYRRSGPHANIAAARLQIDSACQRAGLER